MMCSSERGTIRLDCRHWLALLAMLPAVRSQSGGSLIPDPNDWYAEEGLDYFMPTRIRYSQTVELVSPNTDTFWGTYQDPVTDHYAIHGVKDRGRSTKFEILDAGTMSNIPRNTRPRNPDYYDEGTQHFFLRYNESFMLRSEDLNKYVGTVGTG